MTRIAAALAHDPEAIDMQMAEHAHVVSELRQENARLQGENARLSHQLGILREELTARRAGAEEIEVGRLAFLLTRLDEAVVTKNIVHPRTLEQLLNDGRVAIVARVIHRAMHGEYECRSLCPTCRKAACDGCVNPKSTRWDEDGVARVMSSFDLQLRSGGR